MKKYFALCLLPLMALLLVLPGCADSKIETLKKEIAKYNATCPQSLGTLGRIDSVDYDEEGRFIVYNLTVNEDAIEFSDLDGFQERVRPVMPALLSGDDAKKYVELMTDCGVGLKAVYKGSKSGGKVELEIPASEIKEMSENPLSEEESAEMIIKQTVDSNKALCPAAVEEGMTLVDVFDDGSNIVFLCDVDEEIYDMQVLSDNAVEIENEIKSELLGDDMINTTGKYLARANRGIIYRYAGKESGLHIDVTLTPDDFR